MPATLSTSLSLFLSIRSFSLSLSLACVLLSSPFHSRNTTFPSLVLSQHEGEGEGRNNPGGEKTRTLLYIKDKTKELRQKKKEKKRKKISFWNIATFHLPRIEIEKKKNIYIYINASFP